MIRDLPHGTPLRLADYRGQRVSQVLIHLNRMGLRLVFRCGAWMTEACR